jgi:hypothetical protein
MDKEETAERKNKRIIRENQKEGGKMDQEKRMLGRIGGEVVQGRKGEGKKE